GAGRGARRARARRPRRPRGGPPRAGGGAPPPPGKERPRAAMIYAVDAPWRIVIVSPVQPAVEGFAEIARALGHEPVAVVTSQGPQGRRETHPGRRSFFDQLIWGSPADLDIAIAHDRTRVAPLLAAFEPGLVLCLGFPWRLTPEALAVPPLGSVHSPPPPPPPQ